jgi:hypothetical protein
MTLTLADFERAREQKFVTRVVSDDGLLLYCYHPRVQYEDLWDDPEHGAVARAARGFIFDIHGNVVARPLPKFFNLGERPESSQTEGLWVMEEKVDGSLGITFHDGREWRMATKASFTSEQALRGRQMLDQLPGHGALSGVSRDLTLLFEIVYPENQIVVDYGGVSELVLITAINRVSGREIPISARASMARVLGCRAVQLLPFGFADLRHEPGKEGFVARFCNGSRLKIKDPAYVEAHRLREHLSHAAVAEHMIEKRTHEVEALLPASLRERYRALHRELVRGVALIWDRIEVLLSEAQLRAAAIDASVDEREQRKRLAQELEGLPARERQLCWAWHSVLSQEKGTLERVTRANRMEELTLKAWLGGMR